MFPSSTTKARSDPQPSKASDLISVTDAGTVKVVSAVQMENVKSGIVVMPPSMRTLVSSSQASEHAVAHPGHGPRDNDLAQLGSGEGGVADAGHRVRNRNGFQRRAVKDRLPDAGQLAALGEGDMAQGRALREQPVLLLSALSPCPISSVGWQAAQCSPVPCNRGRWCWAVS